MIAQIILLLIFVDKTARKLSLSLFEGNYFFSLLSAYILSLSTFFNEGLYNHTYCIKILLNLGKIILQKCSTIVQECAFGESN